jgi:hypothetical protein
MGLEENTEMRGVGTGDTKPLSGRAK